jgi:hypothetical protein
MLRRTTDKPGFSSFLDGFAGFGIWLGVAGAQYLGNMVYAYCSIPIASGIGALLGLWATTFTLNV